MELRKVQITGKSTFIVSLPKEWAKRAGIRQGSTIAMFPQSDGSLLINPKDNPQSNKNKILNIKNLCGETLKREIIGAYLAGYNIIELIANPISSDQKIIIRDICQKLIGPEIIEETANKVILQDLINPNKLSIDRGLIRILLISESMYEDAIKALKTNNIDLAKDVSARDDEVDRLYLLLSKQFNSILQTSKLPEKNELSMVDAFNYRLVAGNLERIADHAKKIADISMSLNGKKIPDNILENIQQVSLQVINMVKDAVRSLTRSDIEMANKVLKENNIISNTLLRLDQSLLELSADIAVSLGIIVDSIGRIGGYSANMAEVAINSFLMKP